MKARKGRFGLLFIAMCALVAFLLVKLGVTAVDLFSPRENAASPREVAAGEDNKPPESGKGAVGIVSESYAAPVPSENGAGSARGAGSLAAQAISTLQQKEENIRKREEMLREKEERLAKIEREVEQKVKDLLALQKEIQSSRNEMAENQSAKVRSLSKIYGTMKPKEAAKLMENLDDRLVMGIISTMTPDEAAAILSIMEVKKAAKISEALSGR